MSIYKGSKKIKDVYVSTLGPNHIKYIPQDIKLELNNGTLTLKAGSKVYVPNGKNADGSLRFDVVTIESDIARAFSWLVNDQALVFLVTADDGVLVAGDIDGTRLTGALSGTTFPTPSSGMVFYKTDENLIYRYHAEKSQWVICRSLPIGKVTATSSGVSSIDQVFNGFGYIGSTVFVLPGVKVNIPSGLNSDNTLKNVEYTVPKVLTYTNTQTGVKAFVLDGTRINWDNETWWGFDNKKNMYTHPATNESYKYMQFVKVSVDSTGKITSFNPIGVKKYSKPRIVAAYKGSQLIYNLKYNLSTTANWQAVGTISGHNFFGSGTFSEYISAERSGTVTFKTPMPSGKYTWRFLYYSQVNHTFSTYRITVTYEDGTTETLYNSSLADTAHGGGEKATVDLTLTFKKPVKAINNYTNSSGGGNGCYGGSGNVQLFFDGSKQ